MTSTLDTPTSADALTAPLSRLYLARAVFAIAWAVLLVLTATTLGPPSIALLLLYPLVDVAAAVLDHRASRVSRPAPALLVNIALSLLATVGLVLAVTSGVASVLLVWGVWAITAGVVQLVVAVTRRALGGQWPMILSGAISVLAGAAFALQSRSPGGSLVSLAGYATLGGVFFLVSALRLRHLARSTR